MTFETMNNKKKATKLKEKPKIKIKVKTREKPGQNGKFPIVAIGASAGGLEAIMELLKHLPANLGMAYIYIQHLDPTHKSLLTEILKKVTKMNVRQAEHMMHVEPDTIFIIPPDKDMIIVDGVLSLNRRKGGMHMPIDQFFTSLAEKQKEAAIGILLSGTANDGTLGLKSIKIAGGITIVQDDSAKFQSMPKSAVSEAVVDMIMSPAEIAKELVRLSTQTDVIQKVLREEIDGEVSNKDEHLITIIQLLKKLTGVDFLHYKMNTIKRRIVRRMLLYKLKTLKDYAQYLKQHTAELNVLYQDLLINVTTFFRDPDTMEYLKKTLITKIVKSKTSNDPIRIWVPACSTGEEAYSIAMVLMEILGDRAANVSIQIFATDLSDLAITKARLGLYNRNDLVNVSPKRLQRFFTKVDGGYRIVKTIRDLCVFAPHNVFKDPPFSRLDFISCCNLMIYLDNILQKKILATFHYALNNNGYLMLGKSETIGTSTQLFAQLEKRYKVYAKKKDVASHAMFEMNYRVPELTVPEPSRFKKTAPKTIAPQTTDLEKTVDEILLTKYIPPSVVVNTELEILQFRGSTGLFLEPSPGKASLNLLKMARPGLAFELRNTIHKANKSGQPLKKTGLEIKIGEELHQIAIEVTPLKSDSEERLFLIIFRESLAPTLAQIKNTLSKDKLVKQLQDELKIVREDMRSIIEEQEASNEELQSANEEIVSSNEELQSINEELETSKEEVESSNEELMTINTELQMRNEQLAEAYEYSEAVFNIISEAVIVLDKDLRIKSANKSFYRIFNLREDETEGMLIYELGNRQWDIPALRKLLDEIMPQNTQYYGYEIEHKFNGALKKNVVLNCRKIVKKTHQQQLVLLSIEDITGKKSAE